MQTEIKSIFLIWKFLFKRLLIAVSINILMFIIILCSIILFEIGDFMIYLLKSLTIIFMYEYAFRDAFQLMFKILKNGKETK